MVKNIYKISSKNTDKIYIGSTKLSIEHRLRQHISKHKAYINKVKGNYYSSFKILECGDCEIELLEECDDDLAPTLEGKYILENANAVNIVIPTRTRKQYYEANKYKIIKNLKELIPCKECGKKITRVHMARHIRNKHS